MAWSIQLIGEKRNNIIKQAGMFIISVFFIIALISCSGKDDRSCREWQSSYEYSSAELREDFEQFRRIMENKTAGLYTDREKLEELLDEAEASLKSSMSELEFYRILAPVLAELRCGHSFLSVSVCMEEHMRRSAAFFPLKVRIIRGHLFVIDDPYDTGVKPGSEILRINGRSASEIVQRIVSNMSTDGRDSGRPRYDAERWFAAMYYSFIDNPERFVLQVVTPGGTDSSQITLPGERDAALTKTAVGVMHDTADTPLSFAFHDAYALLKVPTFSLSDPKTFARSLKDFFSEVDRNQIQTLILDLRGNYGGTPTPTAELFTYLIDEPLPFFAQENPFYLNRWKKPLKPAPEAFDGDLFVLMDEAGFSMNGFLLSLLKYHGIGTLVGAPSSGGFMCSDAAKSVTLKNTGLRLRYSTQIFRVAVEGQEPGIGVEPDVAVQWTLEDYLEGHDPVMSAAISLTQTY